MRGFNNLIHFVNCVNIAELTGVPILVPGLSIGAWGGFPQFIPLFGIRTRDFRVLTKSGML